MESVVVEYSDTIKTWNLACDSCNFNSVVHAREGEPVIIPYMDHISSTVTSKDASLYRVVNIVRVRLITHR